MCYAPSGRFDANPLYEILDILKLEDIFSLEVGKYMYKVERNLLPVTIANYFSVRQPSQHRYNRRSRNTPEPTVINYRTSFGEKSIQKRGTIFGIVCLPILRNVTRLKVHVRNFFY